MPSLLDFFETSRPTAKRIRLSDDNLKDSTDKSCSGDTPQSEKESSVPPLDSEYTTPAPDPSEVPIGNEDDDLPRGSQTELETSLPQVATGQEAIEQYEASKAAEADDEESQLTLQQRLGERKWQKGRSSIYVDAFNLALETVLEEEAHLFDEPELDVFSQWRNMSYEAQYLYVRLFLRKTAAWHRINRLGYYQDIADISQTVTDLRHVHKLPTSTSSEYENPAEYEPPAENTLGSSFRFAEGIEEITSLEEASSLLLLDELKLLAKDAKVQGKNKTELLTALRQASQTQGGLTWDSENSNRDNHFHQKILDITGDCIKLSPAPLKLFERVHLVFYRSTEWTEKSLTTIILAKISRKNFPDYIVSRSTSIFPSRAALLEFEAALRIQFEIDNILEFSGKPTTERLQRIKDLGDKVYPRWKILLEEEQRKEDSIYLAGEGAYLRRFSPAWVYTRILHKTLHPLARFKEHKREYELLTELLDQKFFHAARRGSWYQRKALLEEHYLWALTPKEDRSDDSQKKFWKRMALKTCEAGLQDLDCHVIFHYDLQKRIMKLEKSLKVVKREQHDFGHVLLVKPEERTIEGIRIEREDSPVKSGSKVNGDTPTSTTRRGRPTVWLDEREDSGECRVENMCLSWYRDQGWKGYHAEGGIVRTLFGYLFYDILFTYVPNVFQTPFQTCPLDLHTDAFYPSRASEINHRLVQIANDEAESIILDVHSREFSKQTCIVGIDWTFPVEDLVEIAQCFHGSALATVCKVMAQEYQQRGGGIPDLFLWNTEKKEVMFVEVKSENDRLSDTQRLWIHVLTGAGIKVELCNAVAREVKYV
ncbi:VRR-NUC domain-containing protein [Talaromyces proteolyticus]|uniref:Fanconi-associated nuclease n=1 Tax=Talaromyces proteolyticus TaxID=1131652 RepID=A0AAD4Q2V3_9EURO|nr:VRR-NUC domain-containing protein [Talaromyces proteolyticus]KAH8700777.1 VRR-NUC domain-containing protein [Talaromyces proteolyticus]